MPPEGKSGPVQKHKRDLHKTSEKTYSRQPTTNKLIKIKFS